MRRIYVSFNQSKQWLEFTINFSKRHFFRKYRCHAYYVGADVRLQRRGLFGHIFLPSVEDTPYLRELVSHEAQHAIEDWWQCRKGNVLGVVNEEKRVSLQGEIVRKFWRQYQKG